jgi:hypothetical protein
MDTSPLLALARRFCRYKVNALKFWDLLQAKIRVFGNEHRWTKGWNTVPIPTIITRRGPSSGLKFR